LRRLVSELASAGAVSFSDHAFVVRSAQRRIDLLDALRVLRLGEIEGRILPGRVAGEWKCKLVARAEGSARRIGVVTVVIKGQRLFVLTVEWEDR
jgi:hypothetical protein